MLPVFNDYIKFLNYKTNNELNFLEEGKYWYDNSIVKGYDINGELQKIVRLKIEEDLSIQTKFYKNYEKIELETWQDTIERNKKHLEEIEEESFKLIKQSRDIYKDNKIAILTSTGKDSQVVEHLVKKLYKEEPIVIFNNTSLDCADSYLFIKKEENDLKIINPKEGFYQWRERINFVPTRFSRACCGIFKEGAMVEALDKNDSYLFFMGMRNQESSGRSGYGDYWDNTKWGKRDWHGVLPIRKWSEEEVWLYILKEQMDFNPKYKKGYSRVGCAVACPYYAKSTWVLDEYWYPYLFNRWRDILREDFRKNNKDLIMNCTEEEYLTCWSGGVYRPEPTEEVIKQFCERNELDYEVGKTFFGHTCEKCGKKIKAKEVIGMNLKFNGRNIEKFYCKKHLKEMLNIDDEQWEQYVKDFKSRDCKLF